MTATYDEQHVTTTHTTDKPVDVDLMGSDYLRWLYGSAIEAGVDGHVIASRMVGKHWSSHCFTLDELDKIDEYVERYGDRNLYLRSTLLARPLTHEGERGGKHEDGWLTHYVADVDFAGGTHASDNLPTEEEALTILAKLPKASALIHSGGGYYAVWRLAHPFPLDTEQARDTASKIGRRIDNALNSHGKDVDRKSHDLAAVSRPPGTLNHKYSPPKPVYLLNIEPDVVYTLDELDKLLPALPTQEPKPAKTTSGSSSGSYADIFAEQHSLAEVLQADTVDRWRHVTTTSNEERWRREGSANSYGVKQFLDTGVVQIWSDSVLQRLGLSDDEKAVSLYRFACLLAGVDDNRPQDAVGGRLADMIRATGEEWRQRQPDGNSVDWITEQQQQRTTEATAEMEATTYPSTYERLVAGRVTIDNYLELPPIKWFIPRWIVANGTTEVYGPPKAGKSYWTLSMALEAARGGQWAEHDFETPRRVCYFAVEAGNVTGERVRGWEVKHGTTWPATFELNLERFNLYVDEGLSAVCQYLRDFGPFDLVIIDTLAAASPELDENSPQMKVVTRNLDLVSRQLHDDAALVFVHHTGKDLSRGGRGHNSLEGFVDGTILVTDNGDTRKAAVQVLRAAEPPLPLFYRIEPATLPPDEDGLCRDVGVMVEIPYFDTVTDATDEAYKTMLDTFGEGETFTASDLKKIAGLSHGTAHRVLRRGVDCLPPLWKKEGEGRTTKYRIIPRPGRVTELDL